MADGSEKVRARTRRHRHQQGIRIEAEPLGEAHADRRQDQHRRRVVQEGRADHRREHHPADDDHRGRSGQQRSQPVRNQGRAAIVVDSFAQRRERADQHQDFRLQRAISLSHRQRADGDHQHRSGEERHRHTQHLQRDEDDRAGEQQNRAITRPACTHAHETLREGQQAEVLQHARERALPRLNHHEVAGLEAHLRKPLAQRLAMAADRQQLGAKRPLQGEDAGGQADQRRARLNHRLDRAQLLVALFGFDRRVLAHVRQRQLLPQRAERFFFAPQLQHHPRDELGGGIDGAAVAVGIDQARQLHVAIGELEIGERLQRLRPILGNVRFGGILHAGMGFVHGSARCAVSRQQAPAEAEEHESGERQAQSHRREVEHGERLAEGILPHLADDDVSRRADQRHQTTQQRHERHRHQQQRRRALLRTAEPDRHRHQCGKRADVLVDHGEQAGEPGDDRHLRLRRAQAPDQWAHQGLDHAGAGNRGG